MEDSREQGAEENTCNTDGRRNEIRKNNA
jgi:hypothetical protein